MLQRFLLHFSLIVLFAFTQMGAATHTISHFCDITQHSQLDLQSKQHKQSPNHQCEQCISHADVESGLVTSPFVLTISLSTSVAVADTYLTIFNSTHRVYSARAPPQTT